MIKKPLMALRDVVALPGVTAYIEVAKAETVSAMEAAMENDQMVFTAAKRDAESSDVNMDNLFEVGTIAKVKQIARMPDKYVRVVLEGEKRAHLLSLESTDEGYILANIQESEEEEDVWNNADILSNHGEPTEQLKRVAMIRQLKQLFREYCDRQGKMGQQLQDMVSESIDLDRIIYMITANLPIHYHLKQGIIEPDRIEDRFTELMIVMERELGILRLQGDISEMVKQQVEDNQKEYYLREQIKAIHKELGEDDAESEADKFERKLAKLKATDKVKKKIKEEISRYKRISSNNSESAVIRGYLETLLAMPWKKMSRDNTDVAHAKEILDADHYGLEKVKERILEYLAVKKLNKNGTGTIICLVGPPGTGKTSIAKSVAKALGRKYVRICLGGVRDEAELRGHRRTYVGAMPGRVINAVKNAKVKNPLILFDEIDKMVSDGRGDPAAAMLEILDPEQNKHFSDHYLELSFDLSKAFFICTANGTDTISRPLLDRMEVIELPGYTENEKFHIAKEHLWTKQLAQNGITKQQLTITDKALRTVILRYTREAGVRGLERRIASLCRKAAKVIAQEDTKTKIRISDRNVKEYLGKPVYKPNAANEKPEIGIVRGLAWTSVGGETLEIEVMSLKGSGKLELTGKLGDVMQESAKIALTYVRYLVQDQVSEDYFEKHDIHIHVPEGATPKDGPSAGVTMTTAIYSAVTEKAVRADVAMTGEVTLRGRVLPIGGLKEKLLAAKEAGIQEVLVPKENSRDVDEMEAEILDGIELKYVQKVEDVLKEALA
ncbi:endopeptidase La [Jutongia huaianensis]|uniref:Lon protease n=1 Tax=Jutongia huaianensis TaxID=2763668 RepID=A0ABR7N1M9_9FIRM|nr:endopeptidase La [Jutongia huaianensis]MBC8562528.1 endopeptidase La [Jutongia huaianensis]